MGNAPAPTSAAPASQAVPEKRLSSSAIPSPSIAQHRHSMLPPPGAIRTPSLVSGSSVSTFDNSPRSIALRRRQSGNIDRFVAQKRAEHSTIALDQVAMSSQNDLVYSTDDYDTTVLGILPMNSASTHCDHNNAAMHPDHGQYDHIDDDAPVGVSFNATPPIPMYAPSITPSTRYTDSPFSHAPTPSSVSSYSSGIVATTGRSSSGRIPSPSKARPSPGRRSGSKDETSKLTPVREASTSSSNKTIRPYEAKSPPSKTSAPRKASTTITSPTKTSELRKHSSRNRLVKEHPTSSVAPTAKNTVQVPPELAHLNVEIPASRPVTRPSAPPTRPSRDGTNDLSDLHHQPAVVQSDLPRLYTSYHKRTPSQDTPVSTGSPSLKSRFGLSSPSKSLRGESPRIDSAISPPVTSRSFTRLPTPDQASDDEHRLRRRDSPAIGGPNPSPAKSHRFGLFSRKSKSEGASTKTLEKPKRQPTKGPAAGTGHEGYGRFGFRGRSGSVSSSSIGLRSPSTDSNASTMPRTTTASRKTSIASKDGLRTSGADLDDFLRERLKPVVLRGSGISGVSSVFGSETTGHSLKQVPSNVSSLDGSVSAAPAPQLLPSAMQKSRGPSPTSSRPPLGRRMSSDVSDDDASSSYYYRPSTSGGRRTSTRLSQISSTSSQVPAPSVASATAVRKPRRRLPVKAGSVDSYDDEPVVAAAAMHDREGLWLRSGPPAEPQVPQKKPSRKFPFFQRIQSSRSKSKTREPAAPSVEQAQPLPSQPNATVAATFLDDEATADEAEPMRAAPVEHYAMLDSVEPVGLEEVSQLVQENDPNPEDSMSETNVPVHVPIVPYEKRHHSLLPAPAATASTGATRRQGVVRPSNATPAPVIKLDRQPWVDQASRSTTVAEAAMLQTVDIAPVRTPELRQETITPEPKTLIDTPEQLRPDNSPRPPRLSPVGRIPRVVSKRDRDRKLPDNSFSRPFARSQPRPSVKPPGSIYTEIREMASPIEAGSLPISSTSTRSDGTSATTRMSGSYVRPVSVSTAHTSIDMTAMPELFSFPSRKGSEQSGSSSSDSQAWYITAHAQPQQEDIWNEYNDLMDEVLPPRTPLMGFPPLGAPFADNGYPYQTSLPYQLPPMLGAPPSIELPAPPGANIAPVVLSIPEQIARFLQPSLSPLAPLTPLTPDTLAAFVSGYGRQSTSTLGMSTRQSMQLPPRSSIPQLKRTSGASVRRTSVASSQHSRGSIHSRNSSLPETRPRSGSINGISSASGPKKTPSLVKIAENDKISRASLRAGALMTSKWLSFGRVLFSPAHNELQLAQDARILIVDGLGSDWSYYVSLSYPNASVYNLCPDTLKGPMTNWPDPTRKPPRNHFQIPHGGLTALLPFPKGFFTAVVFRFPRAAPEEAYQGFLSECKRVLRPGGFLEVAVLDLDLANMGNRARKAVRDLKTRIQASDRDICLRNLSDVLVRLIGRRGFDDVQRCLVGVPTVGRIPSSRDLGSGSSSEDDSLGSRRGIRFSGIGSEEFAADEFRFADLLEQDARGEAAFVPGKNADENITRMVARVGRWWYTSCYEQPSVAASIFADRALRRECEVQGTSFKLLICHAQKPMQPRRRTVSV